MDADHKQQCVEAREADPCVWTKEEAVNREKPPLLAAYAAETLSAEAAEQLVRMSEDASSPAYAGEDLPAADKSALLQKAAQPQKSS
jgi:hypothetical protein